MSKTQAFTAYSLIMNVLFLIAGNLLNLYDKSQDIQRYEKLVAAHRKFMQEESE